MVETEKKKIDTNSNIIYVGNKPQMNYVTAIMSLLNSGGFTEVVLKARGNAISRAVDSRYQRRRQEIKCFLDRNLFSNRKNREITFKADLLFLSV